MKKLIASLLILVIGIGAVAAFQMEAYGGVGAEFYYAEGFQNTRISDYRRWGASEGSLLLNLADMNKSGVLITVQGGVRYETLPNLYALGEACLGFISIDTYALQLEAGGLFMFPMSLFVPNFHVGVGAKVGVFDFTKALGHAQVLQGTTPPVILEAGTIETGDSIEFSTLGVSITPFVDFTFDLGSFLAIGVDIGFQWAISFKSALYANKSIEVSTDSQDFYLPNSSYPPTRMSMSPVVSLTGFKANVHVSYRW